MEATRTIHELPSNVVLLCCGGALFVAPVPVLRPPLVESVAGAALGFWDLVCRLRSRCGSVVALVE